MPDPTAILIVRPAAGVDIDAIVAMQRTIHEEHLAWDAARWTTQTSPAEVYPAWMRELISAASHGLVLVAVEGETAIGYLVAEVERESARHWIPRAVYVHDLYVLPTHRRRGAAAQLMNDLLGWAMESHGGLQLRLTTAVANEAARKFFARYGFRDSVVEMLREPRPHIE